MAGEKLLTKGKCLSETESEYFAGRVILLDASVLPENIRSPVHQMYFCTGGPGSLPIGIGSSLKAVSLFDGSLSSWDRDHILGIAKPEILTDHALLQLSQIRPLDSEIPAVPEFFGYCFLSDGQRTAGVPLLDEMEVRAYIDIQRACQHRVVICDQADCWVREFAEGKSVSSPGEGMDAWQREQEASEDMELKL